jgi:hypothetical protein
VSVAWIAETKQQQISAAANSERLNGLLTSLATVWFEEFVSETKEQGVAELNRLYPDKFGKELRSAHGPGLELRCGPNTVVIVSLISGPLLKITRYRPTGRFAEFKAVPDHYLARLDGRESLYFEARDGRPVSCSDMSHELLGFLLE